jgi:nuclear cap-binding protein subunit 2
METRGDDTVVQSNLSDAATTTHADAAALSKNLILPSPPPRAPEMQFAGAEARLYWDRSHYSSPDEQMRALAQSATLYVGNLAFTTRSCHVTQHFSWLGGLVKRVVMGLDRLRKTPCGFCFVEYYQRSDALAAVSMLSGTKLDGRVIRVELDAGFQPGRQYGRGISGGQVRDDVAKRNQQAPADGNKRRRGDNDDGGAASHYKPPSVSLDEALPSARPAPASVEDMDDADEGAPAAKRQKRE